jgi:pyrroloquinoline-quinone synthase
MTTSTTQRLDLTDNATFVAALHQAINRHAMLKHPYYTAWSQGRLTLPQLREYAKQYYHQVVAFPRYVSGVHANCEDLSVRQMLLQNLSEEEQGDDNHPELWRRFCDSLGVSRAELAEAEPTARTRQSVGTFLDITRNGHFLEGLAGLFAYESQIPEVAKSKREGLRTFFGISDTRAVSFFTVHEHADLWHRQVEEDALLRNSHTADERTKVILAAERAALALWQFLDGFL